MANDYKGKEKWSNNIELLAEDSDHEMASFERVDNKYFLYYNSNKEFPGESYNGEKIYYSSYDSEFRKLVEGINMNLKKSNW